MVHRALLGSVERFFGILIEHLCRRVPLWLAPVQVQICPVSEKSCGLREAHFTKLKNHGCAYIWTTETGKIAGEDSRCAVAKDSVHAGAGAEGSRSGTVSLRHRAKGDLVRVRWANW